MEDSVAVNIAVAKGLLVCYKRKWSFGCIYEWACSHITFAHKGIAEERNLKENVLVPVLGFICLMDLKWKGKFTFLQVYFPFTVLTVNYKVGCYFLSHTFVSIIFFLLLHFTFCFNNCSNVNYLVLRHQLTTSLFHWSHIVR